MKSLIESLHDSCKVNVLDEKILVVDSYAIGEQIILQYMKQGHHAINLKIKTVRELAMETVETHHEFITSAIGSHLVYSLLKKLKAEQKLHYFHELEVTPTLSHGMHDIIQELRLAGFTSDMLKQEQFVSIEKGKDMIHIVRAYERLLQEYQLIDDFTLYQKAIKKGRKSENIFLLQNNLVLTHLQEQFLEMFLSEKVIHLPLAPVYGVTKSQQSTLSGRNEGQATPLSYIYHLEPADERDVNLDLFTTKTEEYELKEVIGRTADQRSQLDESVILYTQRNPYVTAMYHLAEAQHLPVTIQEGIPIRFTRPGKLVAGLLKWMKESYSVPVFINLLQEGLIDVGEEGPSKMRWTTLLRKTRIGWGESRYLSQLQREIDHVHAKIDNEEGDQKQAYFHQLHEDLSWLLTWYQSVFSKLPISQNSAAYKDLLLGIKHMVKEYSSVSSSYDQAAKESLLASINDIVPYANEEVTLQEGMDQLEELLLNENVGASRPKPGHVHMASFHRGVYVNRENVFIVGLDNQRFPGGSGENPLLLDIERKRLGHMIPLLQEKSKAKLHQMLQVLASSTGNVTLSYCHFNVNENRAVSPSHLFLQCYRFQTGEKDADFQKLKQALPTTEGSILTRKDWWTRKLSCSSPKEVEILLLHEFDHIVTGMKAEETRESDSFTVYDGKIESDTSMYDPRMNPEQSLSARKLQELATCPYKFYLQEILKIKPIEEVTYDQNKWLDHSTRGSLLHEIFENFYNTLQERTEKASIKTHLSLIQDIARDSLEKIKEHVPAPSTKVEFQETEEILESCETFLKIEEETSLNGDPIYFEYTFGVNGKEPATITLPSGSFHLSGKVDRVDQLHDGTYHIIDYKTGSTWAYDENSYFRGGRQLQHFLYTLAVENHLPLTEGAVQKSSYHFPTKKGLGQAFERVQEDATRTNGRDILEKLLSIIQHGHFTMTDDKNDCTFCDFKTICRRSNYEKDQIDLKHQDKESIGVRSFKGVRAYD